MPVILGSQGNSLRRLGVSSVTRDPRWGGGGGRTWPRACCPPQASLTSTRSPGCSLSTVKSLGRAAFLPCKASSRPIWSRNVLLLLLLSSHTVWSRASKRQVETLFSGSQQDAAPPRSCDGRAASGPGGALCSCHATCFLSFVSRGRSESTIPTRGKAPAALCSLTARTWCWGAPGTAAKAGNRLSPARLLGSPAGHREDVSPMHAA